MASLPLILGAAAGGLANLFGGGSRARQTTTLDPQTRAYMQHLYGVGQGVDFGSLMGGFDPYAAGGQQGLSALMGDPDAVARMMNPYLSTMDPFWAERRAGAATDANQAATLAGAFGGSRHGVATGTRLGAIDQAQAMERMAAFEAAMGRAGGLANLGFGANQARAGLGLDAMRLPLSGPHGSTTSYSGSQGDPWSRFLSGAAGGAMIGQGLFPGQGAAPVDPRLGAQWNPGMVNTGFSMPGMQMQPDPWSGMRY